MPHEIVDAWAQHPTLRHITDPMFESLRRRTDTSACTARRYPPALVEYLRGRGRKKVLFGTNYPMLTPVQALTGLDALGLDDETMALFLAGNARRVFGLDAR